MKWIPLAPRARWLFHLRALTRLVVAGPVLAVGAGIGIGWWLQQPLVGLGSGAVVGFLLTAAALWLPTLAFDAWRYALTERELLIRSGVVVRRVTAIPVGRIQHVDTHQGPLDQLFGLARVLVYTASGMGADGVVPGLDRRVAEALRDRLIEVAEGDDGV
jgi:uncharacterized protein